MNRSSDQLNRAAKKNSARGLGPVWWVVGLAVAALASRMLLQWNASLPFCGFREMTGVPCPLCGGTRAMRSIAEFDFSSAAQFNPLVFAVATFLVGWFLLKVVDRTIGMGLEVSVKRRLARLPVAFIAFGLLIANWFYLIFFLP